MTIVENLKGKIERLRLKSTGKDFHSSMFSKCPAEGELSFFPKQWQSPVCSVCSLYTPHSLWQLVSPWRALGTRWSWWSCCSSSWVQCSRPPVSVRAKLSALSAPLDLWSHTHTSKTNKLGNIGLKSVHGKYSGVKLWKWQTEWLFWLFLWHAALQDEIL